MTPFLTTSATAPGAPLAHHWSRCVGAGRAREGLDALWQQQLSTAVQDCGFRYLRCHGLFHDDMFVYREHNGQPVYNWQYVDAFLDALLERGVRPFVELSFCPRDLAADPTKTIFWWRGITSPPKDYARWGELVAVFARHCISRYGLAEVRQWYFEVWNEPNLVGGFWHGTREQYLELYRASAWALKAVDAQLRVGGPSSSGLVQDDDGNFISNWTKEFLALCATEGVPVDFVAAHSYPCYSQLLGHGKFSPAKRAVETTRTDLQHIRALMAASGLPNLELHITEWNLSVDCRDLMHDWLPAAAYVLKANLDCLGLADSLSWWAFTDIFEELGAGPSVFHGGFGLINYQGIVKPTYHAYRFLNRLGDELLARTEFGAVTRHSGDGRLAAVLYHFPEPDAIIPYCRSVEAVQAVLERGQPEPCHLRLTGLPPGAGYEIETLDREHGWAWPAWQALGAPEPPDREQTAWLRSVARATARRAGRADTDGILDLHLTLQPWEAVCLTTDAVARQATPLDLSTSAS